MTAHSDPTFGICLFPLLGVGYRQDSSMRPRDVLAANLRKLMAATPGLSRFTDITAASGDKLTNGTLDRIRRATHATSVDTLADLAEVFGVEPWQLLVPTLKAEEAGDKAKLQGLPDWPFQHVPQTRFLALNPEQRAYVEGQLQAALNGLNSPPPKPQTIRLTGARPAIARRKAG